MSELKISILCDNKVGTKGAKTCLAEWGFSAFIELGDFKILFDAGHTHIYMHNAKAMGIDLQKTNAVAVSHHHWDHIGGLYQHNFAERKPLYMHDDVLTKVSNDEKAILESSFELKLSKIPIEIYKDVFFLGEIPRKNNFEPGKYRNDKMLDDSGIAIKTKNGAIVISGCAHSGICNMIEYAKEVTEMGIYAVIGGFHLFEASKGVVDSIVEYFKSLGDTKFYPMHCIDLASMAKMKNNLDISDTSSGDVLIFEL